MEYFVGWLLGLLTMVPVGIYLGIGWAQMRRKVENLSKKNSDRLFLISERAMED
jgi:hypothetical protein